MNKAVSILFAGLAGAGIGFLAGWQIPKKHFKKQAEQREHDILAAADREIESVKKAYSNLDETTKQAVESVKAFREAVTQTPEEQATARAERVEELKQTLEHYGVVREEVNDILKAKPYKEASSYTITADEYGALRGYEASCATYYEDGHLVRDTGLEFSSPGDLLDDDAMSELMDSGMVYIRDDRLMEDFEIIYEPSPFDE